MRTHFFTKGLVVFVLVFSCQIGTTQSRRSEILTVRGRIEEADVVRVGGRRYVDLQAVARILNASFVVNGERITLNLPDSVITGTTQSAAEASQLVEQSGLTRDFMRAGIEEIATLREWASTMAYAIQNNYQVTEDWAAKYREQASSNLQLASAAATTEADKSALQLLRNEFEAVREWNSRLLHERTSMDTAKYALSQTALRDDPMSQKIITCGRFLAQMLGSASFQDDGSCH